MKKLPFVLVFSLFTISLYSGDDKETSTSSKFFDVESLTFLPLRLMKIKPLVLNKENIEPTEKNLEVQKPLIIEEVRKKLNEKIADNNPPPFLSHTIPLIKTQ